MKPDPQASIRKYTLEAIYASCGKKLPSGSLVVQTTAPEFEGDLTLVLFPLLRLNLNLGSPQVLGRTIGEYLLTKEFGILKYTVINGYLNITFSDNYWEEVITFASSRKRQDWIWRISPKKHKRIVVEFCSPNTNKPLHLGHLRNIFLGDAISRLYQAVGYDVVKANLVNDRGVHICKSMWAWQQYGQGDAPGPKRKGDHLVGDYYVRFEQTLKAQAAELMAADPALSLEEARKRAPATLAVQEMLRQWEAADPEVRALWQRMNDWVYQGFKITFDILGISFDKVYKESDTYLLGKEILDEGLATGVFYRRPDGSVWVDLTAEGLDEKLLLRADGTSVYMTQDLGTADLKYRDHAMHRSVYVVGNEQDYHFKVLFSILKKLGRPYAQGLYHLSYGMVELPSGKMKSREGTVVDADELLEEVIKIAKIKTEELGKFNNTSPNKKSILYEKIGIGALKYSLLKVNKSNKILFNPDQSIDFRGDSCTYIQYNIARINQLFSRFETFGKTKLNKKFNYDFDVNERRILVKVLSLRYVIIESANSMEPALICNYALELAQLYSKYYKEKQILSGDKVNQFVRIWLSILVQRSLKKCLELIGVRPTNRM